MTFQYFSGTDMLYIKFAGGISVESEEITSGVVLDFDENNRIIGIEFEDASTFVDLLRLEVLTMPLANVIVNEKVVSKTQYHI